jgi:branched-chain amino acid transport system ATP-binding protein
MAEPILLLDGIRVRYPNGALGVQDVSLQVQSGQVVGLFGPNGAGKTTTVRAAGGFLRSEGARITSGKVTLAGQAVTNWEPHRQARLGLSLVPERNKVFAHLSVAENMLAVGRAPRRARKKELVEFIYSLFPILLERRRQLAGRLSGGERQMLALARGIYSDPDVLVIDEMSLGLHESVQKPLYEAVRRVADVGTAVLLVDERTASGLAAADYGYLLADGLIGEEGAAEVLRRSPDLPGGHVEVL